ncbi:MAG: hypothetical protein ABW092_09560 [Candidatus Thiodiazotropha sp.]
MKYLVILLTLFSSSALAVQLSDPDTICETKTATLALSSFKHCKTGDLVKVGAYELQRVCELNSAIVPVQNEFLCTYRGSKRAVRERPLSKAEKALEKESIDNLVEKYAN